MLVLQRKIGQEIAIGDNINITILEVGNDWVKLAVKAPRDISILRAELIEAASANQEAASVTLSSDSISKVKDLLNEHKNNGNT